MSSATTQATVGTVRLDDGNMSDEKFINRAIRIAMNARGRVEPNPMVGCVLVKDERTIGEGFHGGFGGQHAEPTALANCTESPAGATAYVTLEPCCHTNKKTPPCAPRLIEAKIARVVIGCLDPNPDVDGKGVRMLREAGIIVDVPVLGAAAKQLLAPFIATTVHHRPYVTLKWAESADGKIAGPGGRRTQISNSTSTKLVHQLRSRCDAIVVGINTVINDDPQLTARDVPAVRPLVRCVLDRHLRIPPESNLVRTAHQVPLIVATGLDCTESEKSKDLREVGVRVIAGRVFKDLFDQNISHVLVEPGPTLAKSMFADSICDRLWVFRSTSSIGDGIAAATVPESFIKTGELSVGGDVLSEYLNPASAVYFAPERSADLVLAADEIR